MVTCLHRSSFGPLWFDEKCNIFITFIDHLQEKWSINSKRNVSHSPDHKVDSHHNSYAPDYGLAKRFAQSGVSPFYESSRSRIWGKDWLPKMWKYIIQKPIFSTKYESAYSWREVKQSFQRQLAWGWRETGFNYMYIIPFNRGSLIFRFVILGLIV